MKGEHLPGADHVARLCPFAKLNEDSGEPGAAAFMLRTGEEYLSVNWLEYLGKPSRGEAIKELRLLYGKKFRVGAKAKIAVLNVGDFTSYVQSEVATALAVLHEPLEPNGGVADPSHSGVYNLPAEGDPFAIVVGKLLATKVLEAVSAK